MKTNQEYKDASLKALQGNWANVVIASLTFILLSELINALPYFMLKINAMAYVIGSLVMSCLLLLLIVPLTVGYANAHNGLYLGSRVSVSGNMVRDTFGSYFRNLGGMLLMSLIVSLFSLLLYIPGIMRSYSYFLVPYLLKDKPELSVPEVLALSKKMMYGYRMRLFKLQLSFLGWIFLSVLTLGIGMIWLMPYMMTTMAAFYQDVKNEYETKEALQESAL